MVEKRTTEVDSKVKQPHQTGSHGLRLAPYNIGQKGRIIVRALPPANMWFARWPGQGRIRASSRKERCGTQLAGSPSAGDGYTAECTHWWHSLGSVLPLM